MNRSKQRGQKRRLDSLCRGIDAFKPFRITNCPYEHFHVPSSFIGHSRIGSKIKKEFCKKWLKTTESYLLQKPKDVPFCKVVSVIAAPDFENSQIIIFYEENYYNSFWSRDEVDQQWVVIRDNRSFCGERNLHSNLHEIGIREMFVEEGRIFERELWFYGDVPHILP